MKNRQTWISLHFVTIWNTCHVRNQIVFENPNFHSDEVINLIYLRSWSLL
ncbi:unnamed protein product [Lupinus luteus]|uniref:Uncharacterized protein n=1 Tax=Lupinus luteus TaxID=3873 RepID=A0AAV1WAM6_LUPLU